MKRYRHFFSVLAASLILNFAANAQAPASSSVSSVLNLANLGSNTPLDNALATFDPTYNNGVDNNDSLKTVNPGETVSYLRDGKLLDIERRQYPAPAHNDTLFLHVTGFQVHQYKWDITINNMDVTGRTAFFIDNYLGTSTALNLTGNNAIMFLAEVNPASNAADRFMIVFEQAAVLPVRFTSISATRNTDKTVSVKWNTENGINMQDYKVQRSNDAVNFTDIGSVPSTTNGAAAYSYADGRATSAINYYRVKGISLDGQSQFTAIVKIDPSGDIKPTISVYPNPVTGGNINLRFENQPKGNDMVFISNDRGQIIHSETVQATNDNFVRMISLGGKAAPGTYRVTVVNDAGGKASVAFVVN